MLKWIRTEIERKRAQSFVENARAWYQTCKDVSEVMGDGLHDQSIIDKDIGYMVDGVDRLLFQLRFYIPDSLGTLRRWNPELAQRFDNANQLIFRLRNETIRFLIRSQGPGPMSGDESDDETLIIYYYRALVEAGFKARDLRVDLDRDLGFIWRDLQSVIMQAERVANFN
ncbi:hypothetical protein ACFLY4_09435 [Chloroflexota bacterium]